MALGVIPRVPASADQVAKPATPGKQRPRERRQPFPVGGSGGGGAQETESGPARPGGKRHPLPPRKGHSTNGGYRLAHSSFSPSRSEALSLRRMRTSRDSIAFSVVRSSAANSRTGRRAKYFASSSARSSAGSRARSPSRSPSNL